MPTLYGLKPAFQARLRQLVGRLARAGATPNQITLAALALSVAAGAFLALWPTSAPALLALPVVLLLRMGLNAIDGMLAREHDMTSRLGAVLNELGDVLADAALYLPLALVPGIRASLLVPLVVLGIVAEMAGVLAQALGGGRRYDGPLGKSDRALLFGALALLLGLGLPGGLWVDLVLLAALALALLTIANRARAGLAATGGTGR